MKILVRVLFITIIGSFNAFAQDTKALKNRGDKLYKLEHYRKALPFFEQVIAADPKDSDATFKAGVCYLHKYSKEKALELILKSYGMDSSVNKYINYWLGRAYHQNYQFDKAIENYNIYKKRFPKSDERRSNVEKYMRQTLVAKKYIADPKDFLVINLGPVINTIYSEHSPVSSSNDSSLLFTSRRDNVTGGMEDLDGEYFEDIFKTSKAADGTWSKPASIQLNTSGHDASVQLFDKDSKLLLYKFSHGGDIYFTEKEGDKWKDPQKFADINTQDFEADAFISKDGKTAFFVTNHYKKKGDLDIYYITKNDNGTWGKPKELKGNINTIEDEDGPVLSPDGKTLYFSSRGHENMGGFDIFKSTLDSSTGVWSNPVNLGHPVNTPDDDVYYYLQSDGFKAYVSSYREGGYGEKDIYEIIPVKPVIVKGLITSENTGKPLNDAKIIFLPSRKTSKGLLINSKIEGGNYQGNIKSYDTYQLAVVKDGDTLRKEELTIPLIYKDGTVIVKDFKVRTKEVDTVVKIPEVVRPVLKVSNIYFEVNKYNLSAEAKSELDKLVTIMKENPESKVEIHGYTDNTDEDKVNEKLSKNRAKTAYKYLVSGGIDTSRLSYTAFGEAAPIGSNDTEEGRKMNRRVEFKIYTK
jgi:outer membrane protein OmpA-like peptidoglycan-associated protein